MHVVLRDFAYADLTPWNPTPSDDCARGGGRLHMIRQPLPEIRTLTTRPSSPHTHPVMTSPFAASDLRTSSLSGVEATGALAPIDPPAVCNAHADKAAHREAKMTGRLERPCHGDECHNIRVVKASVRVGWHLRGCDGIGK